MQRLGGQEVTDHGRQRGGFDTGCQTSLRNAGARVPEDGAGAKDGQHSERRSRERQVRPKANEGTDDADEDRPRGRFPPASAADDGAATGRTEAAATPAWRVDAAAAAPRPASLAAARASVRAATKLPRSAGRWLPFPGDRAGQGVDVGLRQAARALDHLANRRTVGP